MWNIQSLTKEQTKYISAFNGNNIAKFLEIQIIANALILNLKWHENIILLISYGHEVSYFCQDVNLNTTCVMMLSCRYIYFG